MVNEQHPTLAILGSTASGKSALALELAKKYNGVILSIDSLALYRHIDIASAKPSPDELRAVPHYGIDILEPDQSFNVMQYAELYREALEHARRLKGPLFLVGGSSFYLKTLLDGISPLPEIDDEIRHKVASWIQKPDKAYRELTSIAPRTAHTLASNDRYRIEKSLLIALATGREPIEYFAEHPPRPLIDPPPLFELVLERHQLRHRIKERTRQMLEQGLVDEVAFLESRYGRAPQSMKAIGIVEVLDYFDGRYGYKEMEEKIITHTARLAKRQRTFNQHQFTEIVRGGREVLIRAIEARLASWIKSR